MVLGHWSSRAIAQVTLSESGWGTELEWQFQAAKHGLKVLDVPIDVTYHEPAKRNPVVHGLRTINGILRLLSRNRPLVALWSLGLTGVVLGTAIGLWVIKRYMELQVLAGGIALISVSLVILGVLTIYTALILSYIDRRGSRD